VHNDAIKRERQNVADQLHLRAANNDDLPAMAALLAAEGLPQIDVAEGITHFQVLDDGQSIVATAGIESHGSSALLRSVVVAPERRGRGLARRLTEHMMALAGELGHGELYLLTMDAHEYFAGLGFTRIARDEAPLEIQRCRQYREQCPDSAVLMRKAVSRNKAPR
jgi:N-acetylglutamate synthase-like GNAT family acetyltransferase